MIIGELTMDEGPLEEEGIQIGVEGHWIEGIIVIEVTLEEEDPLMMEDPLIMENPWMMMEDPLMMVDPLGMDKIQDTLEDRATRSTRTSYTSEAYYSTAAPGYFGYYSIGKYIWNSWPVYVTFG